MLRDEVTNKTELGVAAKKIMDAVRPSRFLLCEARRLTRCCSRFQGGLVSDDIMINMIKKQLDENKECQLGSVSLPRTFPPEPP